MAGCGPSWVVFPWFSTYCNYHSVNICVYIVRVWDHVRGSSRSCIDVAHAPLTAGHGSKVASLMAI